MIFEGNTVTVQDSSGVVTDKQKIQESDKVVPNQPAGQSVEQAEQLAPEKQSPTVDDKTNVEGGQTEQTVATPEQPTTPEAPTNPSTPSQPEKTTKPVQSETPTQPEAPTQPEQPVEPQIKYTVWFTAYDGDDIFKNIVRGSKLFKTEAEATTFIDNYADQLLMQGIAGSYGVMSWEV